MREGGTLWSWGRHDDGRLGEERNFWERLSPNQIGTDTDWASVAAGSDHSVAIKTDGTLWTWGDNEHGELGDGTTIDRPEPVQIGDDAWKQVSGGWDFTVGIRADGTLWAWGQNNYGQLGDGTNVE